MTDPTHSLQALAEVRAIDAIAGRFRRHPEQVNTPHQADAELVRLTALGPDLYLAATIDGITSEITGGFYKDLYTAGWVLVQANLSDLAAVGAAVTGLMLALSIQPGSEANDRLSRGIADALEHSGVPVLGGDLNESALPTMTACAIGLVRGRTVTRTGIRPGDRLWATGPLGAGNALAIVRMLGLPDALFPEEGYRPSARLAIGQAARPFARAMMDTSDGPMSTLDHLARLNGIGWDVAFDMETLLDPKALAALQGTGAPLWPLFCGEHGEYELMIAVDPADEERLREIAPQGRPVATASLEPGIRLHRPDGSVVPFDGSFIRNLAERSGTDWRLYAAEFQAFGERLGLR